MTSFPSAVAAAAGEVALLNGFTLFCIAACSKHLAHLQPVDCIQRIYLLHMIKKNSPGQLLQVCSAIRNLMPCTGIQLTLQTTFISPHIMQEYARWLSKLTALSPVIDVGFDYAMIGASALATL